jgi:hypothetical protein
VKEASLDSFCRNFVKSICTRDTLEFLNLIEKDSLYNYWRQKAPTEKNLKYDELYFPYFFVYSPWIVRKDLLLAERQKKIFFEKFEAIVVKKYNALKIRIEIKWKESRPNAEWRHIFLLARRYGDKWKAIGSDW